MKFAVRMARHVVRAGAVCAMGVSMAMAAQPGPADLDKMSITARAAAIKAMAQVQAAHRGQAQGELDQVRPVLTALNLAPEINADRRNQELKVSLTVTDDLSGLASMLILVRSPSGRQVQGVTLYNLWGVTKYSGTVGLRMDAFTEAGEWSVESVSGSDVNQNYFWCGADCLSQLGGNHRFMVRSSASDLTPPQLLGGKILTSEVLLSKPAKGTELQPSFTRVQVTLGDEGASGAGRVHLTFCSEVGDCFPMNESVTQYGLKKAQVLVGLQQNQWSTNPGLYELTDVEVWDNAGNSRLYTSVKTGGDTDFSQLFPTTTIKLKVKF